MPFFNDYIDHPYIEAHVHLRRGDLGRWNHTLGEWEAGAHKNRMITTVTWQDLMSQILESLPWSTAQRIRWTIYTEANHTISDPVLTTIRRGQLESFNRALRPNVAMMFNPPPVRYVPDELDALDTLVSFSQGDLLILSPSEFGYASCMLNPMALRIGIWYGLHWHGCLNSLQIPLRKKRLPLQWDTQYWVPESVLTGAQKAIVSNQTELFQRVQDQIDRVDKIKQHGKYPYDQQQPDFIPPHRDHLLNQLERDVTLGFVSKDEARYKNLVEYVKKHDNGKIYDHGPNGYFENKT